MVKCANLPAEFFVFHYSHFSPKSNSKEKQNDRTKKKKAIWSTLKYNFNTNDPQLLHFPMENSVLNASLLCTNVFEWNRSMPNGKQFDQQKREGERREGRKAYSNIWSYIIRESKSWSQRARNKTIQRINNNNSNNF